MSPTETATVAALPAPGPARPAVGMVPAPPVAARSTVGPWLPWLVVLGLVAVTVGLGVVGTQALVRTGSLGRDISGVRGVMAGPVLFAVVGVLAVLERVRPAEPQPPLSRGHVVDACYLALFAVAVVPALTVVETGLSLEVHRHAAFLVLGSVPLVPHAAMVAAVLVAVDGLNWLAHAANHRWRALWRLHALHHSQEEMGVFTTFRTHPLIHSVYLISLLPALVLGAAGALPVGAVIAYGCLVTVPHANLRWTFGRLGRVVVSPAYHRIHHARTLPADGRAANLGFVLVVWDRLWGRAVFPAGGPAPATGLAGRPVPVERERGGAGTLGVVVAQLVQPLRPHPLLEAGRCPRP